MTDEAVSTVIGTVIVLGVVVGAIALFQLTVVPDMTEEAEADHAQTASRGMADLSTDVLQQLRRSSQGPLSSTVPLARPSTMFVPDTGSASLSFDEATGNATEISSPSMKIVQRDGRPVLSAGTSGEWQIVQSGETISQIDEMLGLRVKVIDPTPSDEDRLRIVAQDANGNYAGEMRVTVDINQPDLDLIVSVLQPPAPGEVVFHNHILSIHQQRWDSDYWIDALLDLYGFDLLLADTDKPGTITFHDEGLAAEYKVSYSKQIGGGLTTIEGAGEVTTDYERNFSSGRLSLETQNDHYVDQDLVLEHGALLRQQLEGSAFLVEPPIRAEASPSLVRLGLDVPQLAGGSDQVSGDETGIVRTLTTHRGTLTATAGQLELAFATDAPERWTAFLDDELARAGLTSTSCPPSNPDSACQYEIERTSEGVRLTVHGPHATDADPADPDERDIVLGLQHGRIHTEVQT